MVAIAKNGDDETSFGADSDTDIEIILGDNLIPLDAGVDRGNRLEGADGGLEKKAHEAEFNAVLSLKSGLNLGAQSDEIGEIGFVEGGENGGGVLSADKAIGNFAAKRGHFFPALAVGAGRRSGGRSRIRFGVKE